MGDCHTNDSCETESGCTPEQRQESDRCTLAEDLLCLAKSAKHELLKDKMKKILEAKIGKKLDKAAEAAVDAMLACYQNKAAAKDACDTYQKNLKAAFEG